MPARSGAMVDIVVLSTDPELYDAISDAVGERHSVWRARSAEESVDLLITGRCGVLLLDLASVTSEPDKLVQQVVEQFPDVVVCVAGRREDEPVLAPLISDGLVYRFMHKPLSPRRAGMFLQAAIRHHCERRESLPAPARSLATVRRLPGRFDPMKWVFVAVGVALFVMLLSVVLDDRAQPPAETAAEPAAVPVSANTPAQADPVLSRARAAFVAGRYESPPGRNALDLYKAVLLVHPENAEARMALDDTIEHILSNARIALDGGDTVEAQRLVDRALDADPGRRSAMQLAQQIKTMDEPAAATEAAPTSPAATPLAIPAAAPPPRSPSAPPATIATPTRSVPPVVPTVSAPVAAVPSKPLPGPVTRLPPVNGAKAPEAAPVAPAPIVVRPDPLAARIMNANDSTGHLPPRQPIYARKVEPLPIAGYVTSRGLDAPSTAPAMTEPASGATAAAAQASPTNTLERLVVTDPVYPVEALRNRTEGWVLLEFTVTPNGNVVDVAVVDAEPKGIFDQAAADALSQWRFRPRIVNGRPVPQRSTVTMRFDVDG
jgi:protein TonB